MPGVLPTPDPTIASCISDEDVAMQLIRLGDASNFSHGRNSTSTLDDAFSGAADASSTGATSDGEFSENEEGDEYPRRSRQRVDASPLFHGKRTYKHLSYDSAAPSDDERDQDYIQSDIKNEDDDDVDSQGVPGGRKGKAGRGRSMAKSAGSARVTKRSRVSAPRKPKTATTKSSVTASLQGPGASRKNSCTTANPLPPEEEDLSTKPRCQRCRKSKKGCDRQRPCGRCRDAGIGREGCISEDEGNGRKGRYGRHMGVTVKKAAEAAVAAAAAAAAEAGSSQATSSALLATTADKSRKRKR